MDTSIICNGDIESFWTAIYDGEIRNRALTTVILFNYTECNLSTLLYLKFYHERK